MSRPDGLEQLQGMLNGALRTPTGQTLGLNLIEIERRRIGFEGLTKQVVKVGSRIAFAEVSLHDDTGRLCATATSTLLFFSTETPPNGDLPGQGT